jgi:hypothetical protein
MNSMKKGLFAIAIACATLVAAVAAGQRPQTPTIEVYKDPTCGCCALWVKHLEANGFATRVKDVEDIAGFKTQHGVPAKTRSCHTAVVNGYVIEGHVPAADVKRLLKDRPMVTGLAVPGMPVGSPGMEVGNTVQPYDVLTFDKQGQTRVYASYGR